MRPRTAHLEETYFVNMASRENSAEIKVQKAKSCAVQRQAWSAQAMTYAVSSLHLKVPDKRRITEGSLLYTNAIMN